MQPKNIPETKAKSSKKQRRVSERLVQVSVFPPFLSLSLTLRYFLFVFGNPFPFSLSVGICLRVGFAGIVNIAVCVALLFARFLLDRFPLLWRLASLQSLHLAGQRICDNRIC